MVLEDHRILRAQRLADLSAVQESAAYAQSEAARQSDLAAAGVATRAQADEARHAAEQAQRQVAGVRQQIATDCHAPGQYRALTVRNQDAWYKAFDVQPGEKLYLAPEKRVKIW